MEKIVLGGKALLCSMLIILSFVNAHYTYIKENPRLFMIDNMVSGVAGGLVGAMMASMRQRPDLIGSSAFIMFLFFFFFNVVKEMSGYYTILKPKESTKAVKTEVKYFKYPVIIICALFLLVMLYQAASEHVVPSLMFVPELILASGIFTAADVLIAKNHKEDLKMAAISSAVIYTVAGILLQFGGFYEYIYSTSSTHS